MNVTIYLLAGLENYIHLISCSPYQCKKFITKKPTVVYKPSYHAKKSPMLKKKNVNNLKKKKNQNTL